MSDEYVWLLKGDNAYKDYHEHGWQTIIRVKTEANEIYYCYAKNKHLLSEDDRNKLLSPICLINEQYKDCLIEFNDDDFFGFIWKGHRCFSVDTKLISDLASSGLGFFNGDAIIKVDSASKLVESTEIGVKSAFVIYPIIIILFIILLLASLAGVYLWLF